jgi:putative CocE/NonD family hydrolase
MKTKSIITLIALFGILLTAQPREIRYNNWAGVEAALVEKSIRRQWIPMRDGVRLDANIFLPTNGEAPYPTVLIRSPYPEEYILDAYARSGIPVTFLENGYAIVFQNERGRYWSEGEYNFLARAKEDGYDTVDWISKQSWSNGKIGTIGCSSSAENQLGLSAANHPAHAAAIAQAPGAGIGVIGPYWEQGNFYRGGVPQLPFASWYHDYAYYGGAAATHRPTFPKDMTQEDRVRVSKFFKLWPNYGWDKVRKEMNYNTFFDHLPLQDLIKAIEGPVTNWDDFIRRSPGDPVWSKTHFANEGDTFGAPMLWVFSWYDVGVAPNVALYNYARSNTSSARAKNNQYMLIGPMPHCAFGTESENTFVGELELGDARYDYQARYLEWFDYWLKGEPNNALKHDKVQYYQMGANKWIYCDQFPLEGTEYVDLYLDSNGKANSRLGDGTLRFKVPENYAVDEFTYDPLHPVPTLGGGACCMGDIKATGAFDQSGLEMRNDILVYSTPVLEEDLNVAGFVEVELYFSSDAKDTDITVKLIDVLPDGRALNLDDNIFRVRYREGYDKKALMEKDKVYKVTLPPLITAMTFKKGHRVRVEISSSNFPRYGRNLNTGGNNFDETEPVVAHNQVHHSVQYPSRIRFPVIQ